MEAVQFLPQLGKALWNLKVMYDQHVENGNEIKELQSFIQDYGQQIPILRKHFQEGGGNVIGIVAFKNLEKDVMEATKKLERWSRNKSFFRVFNSVERMQKLGKLHSKVMASVQKSLGIANLSMLLDLQAMQATILESNVDLQASQATILESNAELKSLLITSIGSMHGTLPAEVRDEVVEASTSAFGDPKFWEDILAAVDNHNAGVSMLKEMNSYEDPITSNLMIDPIVASDGNTYCRWTIIDNNLTTNPFNVDEDLTIVIDNLAFRRSLFEKFPEQAQIFRQRRNEYRNHAFSLKAQGLWGDAVLVLHYVLQWDKHDVKCVEALEQVQRALQEAKEKYLQPSTSIPNETHGLEMVPHFTERPTSPQQLPRTGRPGWESGMPSPRFARMRRDDTLHNEAIDDQEAQADARALVPQDSINSSSSEGFDDFDNHEITYEKSQTPVHSKPGIINPEVVRSPPQLPPLRKETASPCFEDNDPPPGIAGLRIVGDPVLGGRLTACGHPINGTYLCIFQWVRFYQDGTPLYIEGAAQPEYVITADDCDNKVAVECVPMDERNRRGEMVKVMVNHGKCIGRDSMMQDLIDAYMTSAQALFEVHLLEGTSEDPSESASLVLRRSSFELRRSNGRKQLLNEKYSSAVSIKVPVGEYPQCTITCLDKKEITLKLRDLWTRELVVLTFRAFLKAAVDEHKKKSRRKWLRG